MSFIIRLARPDEYAEVGRITAAGYHADDLLRLPDGSIDEATSPGWPTPPDAPPRPSCWWPPRTTGCSARSPGARRARRGEISRPAQTRESSGCCRSRPPVGAAGSPGRWWSPVSTGPGPRR